MHSKLAADWANGSEMSEPNDKEPDWDEIVAIMREAQSKSRGYANYWEWAPDRSLAEVGVATALAEYLAHVEGRSWASIQSISDDPPDVLLLSTSGDRIGVEVTELIDGKTVERHRYSKKIGTNYSCDWVVWTGDTVARAVVQAIEKKDRKLAERADQYDEVFVAIATDEPMITLELAQEALRNSAASVGKIQRAFLLLSYHPAVDTRLFPQGIPVLPVTLQKSA